MADLDKMFAEIAQTEPEDTSCDYRIDEDLRVIAIPERGVVLGVEGDKDVNRIRFRMNRMWRGNDLSAYDLRINYENAEGDKNYYAVVNKTVTGDTVVFDWIVAADAVAYKGDVWFIVVGLVITASGIVKQAFHTTLGHAKCLEGLVVDIRTDAPEIRDFMTSLKNEVTEYAQGYVDNAKDSADAAKESETHAAAYTKDIKENRDASAKSAAAASTSASNAAASEANALRYSQEAGAKANTDKTLTVSDAPADAYAVGSALAEKASAAEMETALAGKADKQETETALNDRFTKGEVYQRERIYCPRRGPVPDNDFNQATVEGMYTYVNTITNAYTAADAGTLLVYNNTIDQSADGYGVWIYQVAYPVNGTTPWVRTRTDGNAWTAWQQLISSNVVSSTGGIDTIAVNKAVEQDCGFTARNTLTGGTVSFGLGNGGHVLGIYDHTVNRWLISSNVGTGDTYINNEVYPGFLSKRPPNNDLNQITQPGHYFYSSDMAGIPGTHNPYGQVLTLKADLGGESASWYAQLALSAWGLPPEWRIKTNSADVNSWGAWQTLVSTATSAAASGDGYVRFWDGTQICWGEILKSDNNYYFTFPVPFANTNYCIAGMKAGEVKYDQTDFFYWSEKETGRIRISSNYTSYDYTIGKSKNSTIIAIGRWK